MVRTTLFTNEKVATRTILGFIIGSRKEQSVNRMIHGGQERKREMEKIPGRIEINRDNFIVSPNVCP